MANKKYYTSWDEMIIGINKSCSDAFDDVCEALCVELNDLLTSYVYGKNYMPTWYDRTYEMADGNIVNYKKIGATNAEFYFDQEPIVTIDNPHHNVLDEGGTMEDLVDYATFGRVEDMKNYIVKRFPQLYRLAMRGKLGNVTTSFHEVD